ncbi:uncharacterized protein LOC143604009 [Bidens hawaiensis]|uniref:uncharacterized protein LOC143604009 n=1 Tax=Bidens hawaiensis TaxID=980011 RepID=UPI004049E327
MKDSEKIDDYVNRISEISSNTAMLEETFEQQKIVKKFLTSLPHRFVHIVSSLEQILDLKTVGFEDVVGRIMAYEERTKDEEPQSVDQEEGDEQPVEIGVWVELKVEKIAKTGEPKTTSNKPMKKIRMGHFASSCLERRKEANITEAKETLIMLQQVDESVYLNEEKFLPSRYQFEGPEEGIWYLDNGASNHMTGELSFFSKLDERVVGRVRFDDNSQVKI